MAAHGARRLGPMANNLFHMLGIELFCAAEGVRFRAPLATSPALAAVCERFHADVAPLTEDRFLAPSLDAAAKLARGSDLLDAAAIAFPELEELIDG